VPRGCKCLHAASPMQNACCFHAAIKVPRGKGTRTDASRCQRAVYMPHTPQKTSAKHAQPLFKQVCSATAGEDTPKPLQARPPAAYAGAAGNRHRAGREKEINHARCPEASMPRVPREPSTREPPRPHARCQKVKCRKAHAQAGTCNAVPGAKKRSTVPG